MLYARWASYVDEHRCSRGEACNGRLPGEAAKALGWVLDPNDDGPYRAGWEYPFVPAGADPLSTELWVCEDCARELEET